MTDPLLWLLWFGVGCSFIYWASLVRAEVRYLNTKLRELQELRKRERDGATP